MDEHGESRGYGYVQYDNKESADKCIAGIKNLELHGNKLDIQSFTKKNERGEAQDNNLYMKNLPNLADLEKKLKCNSINFRNFLKIRKCDFYSFKRRKR